MKKKIKNKTEHVQLCISIEYCRIYVCVRVCAREKCCSLHCIVCVMKSSQLQLLLRVVLNKSTIKNYSSVSFHFVWLPFLFVLFFDIFFFCLCHWLFPWQQNSISLKMFKEHFNTIPTRFLWLAFANGNNCLCSWALSEQFDLIVD